MTLILRYLNICYQNIKAKEDRLDLDNNNLHSSNNDKNYIEQCVKLETKIKLHQKKKLFTLLNR